jgi:hypothetical protein
MEEEITIQYLIDIKGKEIKIYNPDKEKSYIKKLKDIIGNNAYTKYTYRETNPYEIIQSKDAKRTLLFDMAADSKKTELKMYLLICVDVDDFADLKTENILNINSDIKNNIEKLIKNYIVLLLALSVKKHVNEIETILTP